MFFKSHITHEEENRRRQLTNFAVKLTLLVAAVALFLELLFYWFVLTPEQHASESEYHLLISATVTALGLFAIMLGMNRWKVVPYWLSAVIFLLALTILALCSDTPGQVMNGRSTMFLMVPILLSGVLIHSYATIVFSSIVTLLFAAYAFASPGNQLNPLNIVFFYLFSGLVSIVLKSLERSTDNLRREVAQSQTILSSLRGGYILTDEHHRILRLNERTLMIFPRARLRENLLDVIRDENIEINNEDLDRLLSVIPGVEAKEVNVKISGKNYYVANRYIPSNKEHLIFLRDVTAEVEIDRLKDTALAMVSHELRTPLTAIRGHAEIALRQPSTAVVNAARILLNTQRLLIMVENLLSQSRLRTGKIKIIPSATRIDTVFRIVHSLLSSEAKEKQLQFVVDVDNNIPVVMVDAILLQQVLTNLASNAIKFTNSGRITLTASMAGEQHWRVSVTDTGPGVPASKRSEIFNEFFQGDAPTVYDRPYQGNGLGLSIVKGLSKQMGGKLALKSVEGEGSTFSIVFPLIFPKETTRRRNKHG